MTDFERSLRRDEYAVGRRGGYRVVGGCLDLGDRGDRMRRTWSVVVTEMPGDPRTPFREGPEGTREQAIRWAVRDAGEEVGS